MELEIGKMSFEEIKARISEQRFLQKIKLECLANSLGKQQEFENSKEK